MASAPAHRRFARALRDPRPEQEALLRGYLRNGSATRFGREHAFGEIRDHREFASRVPVRDYDAFRPWIEATWSGEHPVLTRERVRRMQPTGGSTGGRKWIPFTEGLQAEFARAVGAWITDLAHQVPAAVRGRAYWSVTPAAATPVEAGMKVAGGFEDDTTYLGGLLAPLVAATLAVPSGVARVQDMDEFRRLTLLHLLRAEDLSLISVWHPSFLELLLDALRADWRELLATLERGVTTGEPALDVPPSPRRARAIAGAGPDQPLGIWPRLALVSCWGDAAAATPLERLQRRLPGVAFQRKGLIATEAIVSIPYRGRHPLALTSHFFEFEERSGRVLPAWEIEDAGRYSVIVTTGGGLHRYRLRDRVQVTGFLERTPCLCFLGKEDGISDRCGEKLDEAFVARALARVFAACEIRPEFAMLAPETGALPVHYVLFLSVPDPVSPRLTGMLERALRENPQYAYATDLGQLGPVGLERVNGDAAARYLERLRRGGARLGDIKPATLSALDGWSRVFAGHA